MKKIIISFAILSMMVPVLTQAGVCTLEEINSPEGCKSEKIKTSLRFNLNLRLGSRGEEVRYLQELLNSDIDTKVSDSGAGSPSQETVYFGPATQRAVKKFQVKHGIVPAAGYWGSISRAKANELYTSSLVKESSCSEGAEKDPVTGNPCPIKVGGPCSYVEVAGSCTLTSVSEDGSVGFTFSPAEKANLEGTFMASESIDGRIGNSSVQYLGIDCIGSNSQVNIEEMSKCGVEKGKTFSCQMSVISNGTCTPIVYNFE